MSSPTVCSLSPIASPSNSDEDSFSSLLMLEVKQFGAPKKSKSADGEAVIAPNKKDIRHAYPKMFEDGMNSSDPDLLRDILTKMFASHSVLESFRLDNVNGKGTEVLENSLDGTENLIQYFVGFVVSIPDSVFLVHEWKVFPRAGNQSCLVFKFSFTGSQTFEYESPCTAEDHAHGYSRDPAQAKAADADGDKKRPVATVTFRETGRNMKYESRKRNKINTIGEYVDANRLNESYVELTENSVNAKDDPNRAIIGPVVIELDRLGGSDNKTALEDESVESVVESALEVPSASAPPSVRRAETKKINMVGVMRFHINSDLQVWKIHCVHIHEH